MKAKDFINEGLFGDLAQAASKTINAYKSRSNATKGLGSRLGAMFSPSRLKYGRSTQDQVAANKFIDKFVRGALETLNVAVKNDLVDATSNDISAKATPSQQTAPKSPTLAKDVEVVNDEPMILRYRGIDYLIGDKGQWVNAKSNKDAPQSFQAFLDKQADIATPKAKTSASPATSAGSQQGPQTTAQPKPKAKPKAKSKPAAQQPAAAPQATPAAPSAKQPRQTAGQKAQALLQKQAAMRQKGKKPFKSIKEAEDYDKLNNLFESIIINLDEATASSSVPQGGGRVKGAALSQTPNAVKKRQARAAKKATTPPAGQPSAPQQAAPADKLSISKYFKDKYLDSFFQGIDMAPAQAKIDALLQNLPNLYKSGQLKKELESLANIAWTLAKKQ